MEKKPFIPVEPYSPPYKQEQNNEAFYAGFSNSTSLEPSDAVKTIQNELSIGSYSVTLENARKSIELEQDFLLKESVTKLIDDPDVPVQEKEQILNNYINNKTIPLSFKDKYINQLNDSYLLENSLDANNTSIVNEEIKVKEIKENQLLESIEEKQEKIMSSIEDPIEAVESNFNFNVGLAQDLPETSEKNSMAEQVSKVIASPLALVDGAVGFIPYSLDLIKAMTTDIDPYVANQAYQEIFAELNELTKEELRAKGINDNLDNITSENQKLIPEYIQEKATKRATKIKNKLITKYGDKVETVTAMYEYLQEQYTKDPKQMSLWLNGQQELKEKLGIQEGIEESYLADFFKYILGKIDKTGQMITPEDPKKSSLLLELFAGIFGAKMIGKTYTVAKGQSYKYLRSYADKKVATRDAKQKAMDERALEKFPDEKVIEGEVIFDNPPPRAPKDGPDINIKENSPIATTTSTSPQTGNAAFQTFINNPETGNTLGLNLQQFLHQSFDGNGTLVGTNHIGSQMDVRMIPEVLIAAERQREIQALDSNDVHYEAKAEFISGINETRNSINNIKTNTSIIVSPTFSTSVPLSESAGWFQSTVIRKNSTENYTNKQEAITAYKEVQKVILENRKLVDGAVAELSPGELVIEQVVNAGPNAWNLVESFEPGKHVTSDGKLYNITYKPTRQTKDGKPVKAIVNYTKQEIIVDKTLIEKSFPPDATNWRFFLAEGKIIGRDSLNPAHAKDIKLLLDNAAYEMVIKNKADYVDIATMHEIAHSENPRQKSESKDAYEERMTKIAYEKFNSNNGNTYIVRWTSKMNQSNILLEDYYSDYGTVPSKRTNKIDAAFQNKFSYKVSGGAAGNIGQVSNVFTPYGQFTEMFETLEGGYAERIQFHRNVLKDRVIQRVLINLSAKEQIMLSKLLIAGVEQKVDTFSIGEIRKVFTDKYPMFGTPKKQTIAKIKAGLDSLRVLANQDFVTANLIRNEILRKDGYDKAFYIEDPVSGAVDVVPVLENIVLQRDNALYSEGGQPLTNPDGTVMTHLAYSLKSKQPVEFTPNVRDFMQKEGIFIYENGMRTNQIYRVSEKYSDDIGNTYDYVIFPGVKPGTLPTITLKKVPGYSPTIQQNVMFGVKYPLSHKHNGREIGIFKDTETGKIINLSNLDYGDPFTRKLTAEQQTNRDILESKMSGYSKAIVGRETLKELSEWHVRNPDVGRKETIDPTTGEVVMTPGEYITMFKKSNEIGMRPLKGYYETISKETSTSKYKNEYLDSTITEDPFRSLITTSNQINANFATQQFLKQAEDIFVKLYVEPGPKSKVTIVPNEQFEAVSQTERNRLETINNDFPFDRGQIKQKRENVEDYKQALRMYDKIRLSRYGQGQRHTANLIRENLGDLADTLENHIVKNVSQSKMLDGIVVGLRKGQKYSDFAVQVPSAAAMQFMILYKPFRQLFIQMPIFMGGLIVASGYNPIRIAQNLIDIGHLTTVQGMDSFWKNNPAYKEMQKFIFEKDRLILNEYKNSSIEPEYKSAYDVKFDHKDIQFINQMREEIMGKLSTHEWVSGLFNHGLTPLGKASNSRRLIDIINPKSWVRNFLDALAMGFKGGEGIGRNGFIIVALRNWMYKNPLLASRWREQKHVNQWMQDSLKGVGWMTGARQGLLQRMLPTEFWSKFEFFGAKMSLMIWQPSASPWRGSRVWENVATNLLMLGVAPYALDEMFPNFFPNGRAYVKQKIVDIMNSLDFTDEAKELDSQYLHLNVVDILGNMYANNGKDLSDPEQKEDILDFSSSLNPYGMKDYPFFAISRVAEAIVRAKNGESLTGLWGAGFGNLEKFFGNNQGFNLMIEFWDMKKPFTVEERLRGTGQLVVDMLPFLKPFDKLTAEKYLGDTYTKTGQPLGIGTEESDKFITELFGVQKYTTSGLFDSIKYSKEKEAMIRDSAIALLTMVTKISDNATPQFVDVVDRVDSWILELDGRGFLDGTIEHQLFKKQVYSLMSKQFKPLMKDLYIKFISLSEDAKYYDEKDIEVVQFLADHYQGDPEEKAQAKYKVDFMKMRNEQYKLIKEGKF